MIDQQVIVFGAGLGGLATAAELRRVGIHALVLDRTQKLGAVWRGRYDRLKLNSSRWISRLPHAPYPKGTALYPSRDEFVAYIERYVAANSIHVRFGTSVQRVDHQDGAWLVRTSAGDFAAPQVVVATGSESEPRIPAWPGRDSFAGRLLHSAEYHNAKRFRGRDVLVIGPGSSGMEIAFDLAEGGAQSVQLAMRTPPNIILRAYSFPFDLPTKLLVKLPPRIADWLVNVARRMELGDLSALGLTCPEEGVFARLRREGKVPTIVDKEVITAIAQGRIQLVPGIVSFDERGVRLADGSHRHVDAVIAATGYRCGLEGLVGHLDVLDPQGFPRRHDAAAAAPGLRFVGYQRLPGHIGVIGQQAKRTARAIAADLRRARRAQPEPRRRARVRETFRSALNSAHR